MAYFGRQIAALIPARAGSVGIPLKNLLEVAGESLVKRSVRHASSCMLIDWVYVSTDDPSAGIAAERISWEAAQAGATVIHRPAELCTGSSPTEAAMLHSLEWMEANATLPDYLS